MNPLEKRFIERSRTKEEATAYLEGRYDQHMLDYPVDPKRISKEKYIAANLKAALSYIEEVKE